MKACHLIAFITACCLSLPASAGEVEIDRERMQQDLNIMEGILQNLHAQNTPFITGIHREPHVRGLYFENYGVIFLIEERRPAGIRFTLTLGSFESAAEASKKHEGGDVVKDIRAQREKRRVAFQDRLGEFLGTYADAIRQLKDEDRITILVHYQPLSPISKEALDHIPELQAVAKQLDSLKSPRKGRKIQKKHLYRVLSEPVYSEVTAKKRDIVAYRRERISEAEFRKRIVSREHKPDASTIKKIGVLATILDKALKRPDHLARDFNKTLGIYQEGLGALFFVNAGSGYRTDHPVFKNKTKELRLPIHRRRQGQGRKSNPGSVQGRPGQCGGRLRLFPAHPQTPGIHRGRSSLSGSVVERLVGPALVGPAGACAEGAEEGCGCLYPGGPRPGSVSPESGYPGILSPSRISPPPPSGRLFSVSGSPDQISVNQTLLGAQTKFRQTIIR